MWMDFALAIICAAILLMEAWNMKNRLLTPVHLGRNTDISVVIEVKGEEPALEQTLKSLVWLNESGVLNAPVYVKLEGASQSTTQTAELFAKKYEYINVCTNGDIKWKNLRNSTE